MLDIVGAAKKAAPIFKKNEWTYGNSDRPPKWPELAETIYDLAKRVETDRQAQGPDFQQSRWSTGRFEVSCSRRGLDCDEYEITLHLGSDFLDLEEELFG